MAAKYPVTIGGICMGGERPVVIAGPCSVESTEQVIAIAQAAKAAGATVLRGGIFKPRTDPRDFQGLGLEGLSALAAAREATGLPIVTEVMDIRHLEACAAVVDMLQIGSRNMYNYALLQAAGAMRKPVLLKRGFSATLREWMLAADYIARGGSEDIVFCERGIRSFETYTRNTLDITAIPIVKRETGRPVIIDPSHGTGVRWLVPIMAKAGLAAGADGVMVEAAIEPDAAVSDAFQTIDMAMLREIVRCIEP